VSDEEQTGRVRAWVESYVRAWNSNDPAAIGDLFTEVVDQPGSSRARGAPPGR
jgi:hypothetical protein